MWRAADFFHQALSLNSDSVEAREQLGDLFFHRYLLAQEQQQLLEVGVFSSLCRRFSPTHDEFLQQAETEVRIQTDPEGAEIYFSSYTEIDRILQLGPEHYIGVSPVEAKLPWCSGVITVRAKNYQDAYYPVYVRPQKPLEIAIKLYTPQEIGEGFCYIPYGTFLFGGDKEAGGTEAREEIFLDSFFISRRHVTCAEYAAFLNSIALRNPQQAAQHAPRLRVGESPFWTRGPDGRYTLPQRDFDGTVWEPDWPVTWISFADAESYAAWRSTKDGVRYRLPREEEWEKAARGVDGRTYPWGSYFDPSFCHTEGSFIGKPQPVASGLYTVDCSVYGVCDVGGNVSDLTTTLYTKGDSRRVVRGGAYCWSSESCRTTWRGSTEAHQSDGPWGIRLVKECE